MRCDRTSPQLNALFKNPPAEEVAEIEVTDPAHPLFGRRFPLRSISAPVQGEAHVFVAYRGHMTLRLACAATNLSAPRPGRSTKLTLEAITDFLALAEECGVPCPADPTNCGRISRPPCDSRSSTNSRRSSTR